MTHPLHDLRLPEPTLVLVDDSVPGVVEAAAGLDDPTAVPGLDARVVRLSTVTGKVKAGGSVLVVAADRARLRQLASRVPLLGQCRALAVWLPCADEPWVVAPRPEWPTVTHLVARSTGSTGVLTVLRFSAAVRAHLVVQEAARQAAGPGREAHGGLVTAYVDRLPAPGLDVRALHLAEVREAGDPERDVPPDVVLVPPQAPAATPPARHHVVDRAPVVVTDALPDPVDERVFNPVGWRRDWEHGPVDLDTLTGGRGDRPVTEAVVHAARGHQAVRVDASRTADVLALAAAGVPMQLTGRPHVAAPLADALAAAQATPEDLADPLRREAASLRVRRAAFDHHSTLAWRGGLAVRSGARPVGLPPVSALLATKRPEMLDFALRQVARQRGADVELVLAAHGFEPDRDAVRRALGDRPHQVVSFPDSTFFGDVLDGAARAASADVVVKVDDDDWYSPDAVHDLLMARHVTGADLVGMPAQYVWLEQIDVTVRRNHPSELYAKFVAGGTLMLDRGLLWSLGGFRPVRRFVDAQLLAAADAVGCRIYRTHGLGYVLRRSSGGGHTWERDEQEFRRPEIVEREWSGFDPSPAMEVSDQDRPTSERGN